MSLYLLYKDWRNTWLSIFTGYLFVKMQNHYLTTKQKNAAFYQNKKAVLDLWLRNMNVFKSILLESMYIHTSIYTFWKKLSYFIYLIFLYSKGYKYQCNTCWGKLWENGTWSKTSWSHFWNKNPKHYYYIIIHRMSKKF